MGGGMRIAEAPPTGVAKHYIGPVCRPADRVSVGQFSKKIVRLVGRLGSGPAS